MLTDAQCQIINQHLMEDVEPRKVAAFLCLHMGLLLGEVTALRRQDIDLAAGMISIRYVAGRGAGGTASDPVEFLPSDAPRDLPMPPSVKLFLSANIGLYADDDCFILNGEKSLPPFRLMQGLLSAMNLKYQIAEKLSSMELRYAFIRQKLEAGVDMYSLCTYLGQNKRPDVIVKRFSEYCRADLAAVAFSEVEPTEYQLRNAPKQMNLLILGAGGQGQVVRETAEAIGIFEKSPFWMTTQLCQEFWTALATVSAIAASIHWPLWPLAIMRFGASSLSIFKWLASLFRYSSIRLQRSAPLWKPEPEPYSKQRPSSILL